MLSVCLSLIVDGVYVGRLLRRNYVWVRYSLGSLSFPRCRPISKNQPSKTKQKNRLVRLPWGFAIVVSCRARTVTHGLLRRLVGTSNYRPSKMRALKSPVSDPSTPLIWSCAGHESLLSIPTVPICHKCNIPSVSVGQGVPGPHQNTCRLKTLVLFTSYLNAHYNRENNMYSTVTIA